MKKIFILFLSAIMLFCCVLGIAACSNDNASDNSGSINQPINPPEDEPITPPEDEPITPPEEPQPSIPPALAVEIPAKSNQFSTSIGWPLKLSGYMTNISNATALGIAKETKSTVQPLSNSGKSGQISLMSKSISLYTEDTETSKSYIVKSTNEYNSNNPDLSSNGIEKITFTKTITDEVRNEINGSNYIIARNDEKTIMPTLTFGTKASFSYSVYLDDALVYENIIDNGEFDSDITENVMNIKGLEADNTYEIRYYDSTLNISGSKFVKAIKNVETQEVELIFNTLPKNLDFVCFVYKDNNLLYSNLTDNCELDINKEEGVISLLNVDKDAEYEIKYNAIGENIFGSQIVVAEDDMNTIKSTISFKPVVDYKYSLYLDGALVYANLEDNSDIDINNEVGTITISNLEKDKEYEIRYEYAKNEIVVTQEQIVGEIDKLYVLGNYTFISYVPNGTSLRPNNDNLVYDTDGIATYDKCNYFSNGTNRQSFIIDNNTGYVYDIKAFTIKEIQGGLLISANDNYIYDFKINDNDEVEIFSLFTNDSIECYSCFKDKYGNKYIQNNRLTTYDAASKTYFYRYEDCNYELTSNGEAIKMLWHKKHNNVWEKLLSHACIMLANGQERNLTVSDTFKILYKTEYWKKEYNHFSQDVLEFIYYKVENGVLYGNNLNWDYYYSSETIEGVRYDKGWRLGYYAPRQLSLCQYDAVNDVTYFRDLYEENSVYNLNYLQDYNVIITYYNGKLYYSKNVWDNFKSTAQKIDDNTEFSTGVSDSLRDDYYAGKFPVNPLDMTIFDDPAYICNLLIDNCSVSDDYDSILTYGINGNTYYDIVVEKVDGKIVVNQYIKGTYVKPQIKIVLQPLNK